MTTLRTGLIVSLLASVVLVPAPAGQERSSDNRQPRATFRAEVNYVEVDVTVTDSAGHFIRDLTREDFEVREDGQSQDVFTFELVDVPYKVQPALSPLSARRLAIEPDVRSNENLPERRVFVLVLDDLHTHALRSVRAKEAARDFVQRYVGPDDIVSVIHTSGRPGTSQEFTTDSNLVLASIDRFMGTKLRSATLERLEAYESQPNRGTLGQEASRPGSRADPRMQHIFDPREMERARQAENMLETLQRLGELLGATRGVRKSVVLISEGVDYDFENAVVQTDSGVSTFTSQSAHTVIRRLRDSIGAMTRANVAVYTIDPRGLVTGAEESIEVGSFPLNPLLGIGTGALQDEVRRAQDSLRVIADETGGVASVHTNDFSGAFDRIMRDASTYYLLGYRSNNSRADGRFRKIDVRVKRPGLEVRARKGYLAPSGREAAQRATLAADAEPSAVLRDVLANPLPIDGVTLRASAAAFKGPGVNGSVVLALEVNADNFKFRREGGLYTDTVEAAVVALDEKGAFIPGDRHTLHLRLKPETYETVRDHGLRFLFRLNLPPGRYQLRAAAHESGTGAAGSVHYDIDVPDMQKALLATSGIVLTAKSAAATPTPRSDRDLQPLLKFPPTASRRFTPADTLAAAFALYHNPQKPVGTVDVRTTVVAQDGSVRFANTLEVSEAELRDAPDGYGYVVEIPLADMTPGAYILRVAASSRLAGSVVAVREVPFEIYTAESGVAERR